MLWCEERKKCNLKDKQSFVDLGCGNGLLVYLLTKEGVSGGVDVSYASLQKAARDQLYTMGTVACTASLHTVVNRS